MLFLLRKSLLVAIVIAMLAVLTLSACGGDDDDADNGTNDPTATQDSGDDGDDDGDDNGADATEDAAGDDDGDDGEGEDPTDDFGFDEDPSELAEVACTLLTPDEIGAEAGITVGDGEPSSIEGFADCRWQSAESFQTVSVSLIAEGGEGLYEFNNDDYEEIDGIGDRAQYSGGDILPLLEVMKDDIYFSITVNGTDLDEEATREAMIDLAHIAVNRLP